MLLLLTSWSESKFAFAVFQNVVNNKVDFSYFSASIQRNISEINDCSIYILCSVKRKKTTVWWFAQICFFLTN